VSASFTGQTTVKRAWDDHADLDRKPFPAYALNHAVTYKESQDFIAVSQQAAQALDHYVTPGAVIGDARDDLTEFIRNKQFTPNTMLAMRTLVNDVGTETSIYKELKNVPNDRVRNFRNDLYLLSEFCG